MTVSAAPAGSVSRLARARRGAAAAVLAVAAAAASAAPVAFDIPAQDLGPALQLFARQAGIGVMAAPELVGGRRAAALNGTFEPAEALRRLLADSGLVATPEGSGWIVRSGREQTLATVQVTGKVEPLEAPYAGGQVARGGRVGMLGDQDLFDTPFNIISFTAQSIANTQAVRASDILKRDPAVRVASNETSFYADFSIRGFRVTGSSFTFDGLSGMVAEYAPSLLAATERVEVIKGANTLLTNAASGLALGGTVNLVPKRAGPAAVTSFTLGFQSDSRFSEHIDLGRRFGPDNAFGARLNLYHSSGAGAFDNEKEKLDLIALSLDWRGERVRATLDLNETFQKTKASLGGLYLDPSLGIGIPRVPKSGANFVQPFAFSETRPRFAVARVEADVWRDVVAYAQYGRSDNRYKQLLPFGLLRANGGGDILEIYQHGTGVEENRAFDIGSRAKFVTGPLQHQLALSWARTRFGNDGFYFFEAPDTQPTIASNIYRPVRVTQRDDLPFVDRTDFPVGNRNDARSYAIADTVSTFDDRLFLTAGVRRQRIISGTYDEKSWSPGYGALFKATRVLSLYANRIKALEGAPSPPDTAANRFDTFAPTQNQQTEIGAKADFGRFGVTLDAFRITRPSGIVDPATNIFAIDGKQRNTGVEFSVFGEPLQGVRLLAGASTIEAKLVKTENGTFDGKRVQAVPKRTAALSGEWDLPWLAGLTVTAGATHTGSSFIDQDNTVRIASHSELELGGRYATRVLDRPLTLRASVSNLLDRRYWVADVYGSFYQGAPRVFSLAATIAF